MLMGRVLSMDKGIFLLYNRAAMNTDNISFRKSTGLKAMLLIGIAWVGMNVFFSFNMASIPLFFRARIDQKWIVGLILSMMGAFGIFLSPLVGMMSDKIRHRLGRRRPLMILALPFMGAVIALTQYIPWLWLMACVWPLAYFFHLIIERPWSALIPDLFPMDKRATANGVVQLMGGMGSLLYFVSVWFLWARNEEATFHLVALVYVIGTLVLIFGIRETPTHLNERATAQRAKLGDYLRGLREHTMLTRYILASLFWNIGLNGVLFWLTAFGTEDIGMSVELSFMPLALSVGILILFAVPVGMLADRVGHKRVTTVGLAIFVVINTCILFVHSIPLVFVLMGIVAFGFCIIVVVPYAIAVNLMPADRMAEFIGIAWIPIYVSILIGPFLSGLLIDIFDSYRPIFLFAAVSHAIGLVLLQGVQERREAGPA